ncbi:MAG: lipid-A-disaccharide synthase [Candidatus Omnitrophota bacterium]|nr:lipid-A-disaccharide synthase [Candidatus Omnitrophota bacterium]
MPQKNILIICGEASGDLHAANLAREILQINPQIRITAVGGDALRQTGIEVFYDIKTIAVMGFFDVLRKLPQFFFLKKLVLEKIKQEKPSAIIMVDFSGFNLRLAKIIKKTIPIIYYISPQVWASRSGRVKTIKEYVSKIIVFFKFEEEFYKKYGINANLIGHPLLDTCKPAMSKKELFNKLNFSETKTTFALLPGSRKQEIEKILPVMLKTSILISKEIPDAQFVIAKSLLIDWDIYNRNICGLNINVMVVEGITTDCLNIADFCLICSGSATLETAIMQKPFVVIYKMGLLNYLLYRPQVRCPYIGMVNIIADKLVCPEFIQFKASPKKIAKTVLEILKNPVRLERIKSGLSQVRDLLGEKGATARAAKIITAILE